MRLGDELDRATSLLDLALSLGGNVAGLDNDWDSRETTLAEELGVAEREEVDNGSGVLGGVAVDVLLTELEGNERPELN